MADRLMAVGPRAVVRTADGRLMSFEGGDYVAPVPVGARGQDGRGTPEQQEYAVYVLTAKWAYEPVFGGEGRLGVDLPDGWQEKWPDVPFKLRSVFLASGDSILVPEDSPPNIPDGSTPGWYTTWADFAAEPPPGWYEPEEETGHASD